MSKFLSSVMNRLKVPWLHAYVLGMTLKEPKIVEEDFVTRFELKEITEFDHSEIDQITEIDPWKVSKSETVKRLKDGHRCAIAMCDGKIIAFHWMVISESFYDLHFNRMMRLSKNEAYCYRAVTMRDYSNQGIQRNLCAWHIMLASEKLNKNFFIALVKSDNRPPQNLLNKLVFRRIWFTGTLKAVGYRIVYLLSLNAFGKTKKVLYVDKN